MFAVFSAALCLILCGSMLLNGTFAWFTDNVTNAENIIQSGNLKVGLSWANGKEDPASVSWNDASTGAIFNYTLWEPGYTEVRHIKIENKGNLALKYNLTIEANGEVSDLSDVIDVYYADPATQVADRSMTGLTKIGTLTNVLADMGETAGGKLLAGEAHTVTLALKMNEEAGNEYQNMQIGSDFSVILVATQVTEEEDAFGDDYDMLAALPGSGIAAVPGDGVSAVEIDVLNTNKDKIASVVVPAGAIADDADKIQVDVDDSDYEANITVDTGMETKAFDVTVTGLKANNDTEVEVALFVGKNLNASSVKLYHVDEEIDCTYDPYTGYVTFKSKTFSPFTVVYEGKASESALPEAEVVDLQVPTQEMYIIPDLSAGFGSGKDVTITPDAAFTFTAKDDETTIENNPYKDWLVDYYVSVDKPVVDGIILIGSYDNWAEGVWYGFNVPAGEYPDAVPLLGMMSTGGISNWTYKDIVTGVGTFNCGVVTTNADNDGTVMTVDLRIMNPENTSEYYVVSRTTHVFKYQGE